MKKIAPIAGWMALFFVLSALFFYAVVPHQKTLIYSLAGVGLANGLFFAFADRAQIKKVLFSRTGQYGMNTLALVGVFLGIMVFINLLTHRHKHRFDFTEGGYFTLAPQTRKIVSNLPREVKLTAFFQTESPEKSDFQNLADAYLELSDKIKLSFVDPDKNPAITKQYGVTTYGTVALESGKQEAKIKTPNEEELTNAIVKVIKDEQKTIYFLEGHGERTITETEKEGYSTAKQSLEKDGFKVDKLLLMQSGEIPEDTGLLIIAGPEKPILPQEQKILNDYLNGGGSVLILTDPNSQSGLEEFLLDWGIVLKNDMVIDPLSKLFGGDFAAPVVSQYTVHEITRNFSLATIFPVLRSVSSKPTEGVEVTELLQTGPNSWAESDLSSSKVNFDEGIDRKGPVPVAAVAIKEISGAEEPDQKPEGDENQKQENKFAKKARLVVVGDSDFANNGYFRFSGNGDFFLNTASWLAQEENLISIRSKERKNSPLHLTRVDGSIIFILGTIVFPACVALAGIRAWWRRRRL